MSEFLAMGGYAWYVWPAFVVFFIVLLVDFFAPFVRRSRILREVDARMQCQKQAEQKLSGDR